MNSYDGSSLVEHTLFGTEDFVQKAIKEIRAISERSGICLRFSGGKDSVVIKHLLDMAGVPYTARFSKTSVDPPELLEFIKAKCSGVIVESPAFRCINSSLRRASHRLGYAGTIAKSSKSGTCAGEETGSLL